MQSTLKRLTTDQIREKNVFRTIMIFDFHTFNTRATINFSILQGGTYLTFKKVFRELR